MTGIFALLRTKLIRLLLPLGITMYVDELPKTIGGKIKRKLIRQTDGIQE